MAERPAQSSAFNSVAQAQNRVAEEHEKAMLAQADLLEKSARFVLLAQKPIPPTWPGHEAAMDRFYEGESALAQAAIRWFDALHGEALAMGVLLATHRKPAGVL